MGLCLATFEFDGPVPTEAEFRARYAEFYSPRVLDLYEVTGHRVDVGCLLDPCGLDYLYAVMQRLGGRALKGNGEPLNPPLPPYTATPWRQLSLWARLRARYGKRGPA